MGLIQRFNWFPTYKNQKNSIVQIYFTPYHTIAIIVTVYTKIWNYEHLVGYFINLYIKFKSKTY